MAEQQEEPIVDLESAYSKSEEYVIENKKSIQIIVGAALGIVVLYFAYRNFIQGPKVVEAESVIWQAEQAFETDSFKVAVEGVEGFYLGFKDIADEYSGTPAGNLANYYAGICYLHLGNYDQAIEYLGQYDGSDEMVSTLAIGAMGDAYAELDQKGLALKYYINAADHGDNNFTAPLYLQKAGLMAEASGDKAEAKALYERIKSDYPESQQANNIEKYIARASAQ